MALAKRKTLDGWIRETLLEEIDDKQCSMIALVHMQGQLQKELHTVKFAKGKNPTPEELARLFKSKAEAYAQDLPGVQTFQLLGFYGSDQPQAFQPFTVTPAAGEGMYSEAPTEQGRLGQSMRHADMLIGQVYRRQDQMDAMSLRMIELQNNIIVKLTHENHEAHEITKNILMEKALDNHNHVMKQLEHQRSTAERQKWMTYLPALVNTVLGREVFPISTQDTALVEGIADAMTEEDVMKLAAVLPPTMMGPLAMRMTQFMEKKKKTEETNAKALMPPAGYDPLLEAGGDPSK